MSAGAPIKSVQATGAVKKQLEDAAVRFFTTLNRAFVTGDETPLRGLITPACACVKTLENLRESTAYGDKIHSEYKIIGVSAHDVVGDTAGVTLSYNIPVNTIEDKAGKIVKRFPPVVDGIKEITLRRMGGKWLIASIVTYK